MLLSEAIRLGSLLRPQITNNYGNKNGTCAMGAAYEATNNCSIVGYSNDTEAQLTKELNNIYPILGKYFVPSILPIHYRYSKIGMSLSAIISRMNDLMRFDREQIADYVEYIENITNIANEPKEVKIQETRELVNVYKTYINSSSSISLAQ